MTMTKIEAFHNDTGQWVTLAEWDDSNSEYDVGGWMDKWGERVGVGPAMLPVHGYVDLSKFSIVREAL
jgi:hypothetical protein